MFQYNTQMLFPPALGAGLRKLTAQEGKNAIRLSLRGSNRVQTKYIKHLIRVFTSASQQSTGATFRASDSKVSFPQKGFEFTGYAMAGISRRHSEITREARAGLGNPSKKTNVRKNTVTILSKKSNSRKRGSKVRKSFVRSWQRSSLRAGKKGVRTTKVFRSGGNFSLVKSKVQKNVPNKYWHLIDRGFTHRSGTVFPGYMFVEKARNATSQETADKFIAMFQQQLNRILG